MGWALSALRYDDAFRAGLRIVTYVAHVHDCNFETCKRLQCEQRGGGGPETGAGVVASLACSLVIHFDWGRR
jgi:hypothetical protein